MPSTTHYNFPLTSSSSTPFTDWWQIINGDNNNSLSYLVDAALYNVASNAVTLSGNEALTNKTYNGYTLGDACAKTVDSTISDATSVNLPTTAAICGYIDTYISTHYPDGDTKEY